MSRQNYYAKRRRRQRRSVDEDLMVKAVQRERQVQPRLGGRKLLWMAKDELAEHGVRIGRDRWFEVLRAHDLLVPRKPGRVTTTDSRHSLPVFGNLVANVKPTGPHQQWVSDMTYIRTEDGFLFSAVVMDRYSRKIIGEHIGDSLEAEGCLAALDMALGQLPAGEYPIHHSDRGCQYCCHEYVARLQERGLSISMTQILHCYENAAAERVIGTLKQEYEMDRCFRTKEQAREAFHQAVYLYNHRRPHLSLNYATPAEAHARPAA